MAKVLVFGIFDGIHPGHINFFKQAKKYGDILVVAVGQLSASKKFKNKLPKRSLKERAKLVREVPYVTKAVQGDREQGSYHVIEKEKPDVICLGYDQEKLEEDLQRWLKKKNIHVLIKRLEPHEPQKYHTSLISPPSAGRS